MGHYWREMDILGAEKYDKFWDRVSALREKLEHIPLSEFTVGDLESLQQVMNTSAAFSNKEERHLRRLEEKIKTFDKKAVRRKKHSHS